MTAYDLLYRAALGRIDAERAHHLGFAALRAAADTPGVRDALRARLAPAAPALRVRALGLDFPAPLGIAAGFDKNAVGIDALAMLGFGFVEIGTVTARPQAGNPTPRLFRLPADRALLNRMGFNNDGAAVVAARLRRRAARARRKVIVGVNIGKSRATPVEAAIDDYRHSAALLAPYADYLVVNVSSPNTPGLRDLQAVASLRPLLRAVGATADAAARRHVPLLAKVAPDLADSDLDAIADLAAELHDQPGRYGGRGLDGLIATNTTISRDGLRTPAADVAALGAGGLSGAPLRPRATQVLRRLRDRIGDQLTLIAAGGVSSAADAAERLAAGATLVQAYTAFVYQGPFWPARVHRELASAAEQRDTTGAWPTAEEHAR